MWLPSGDLSAKEPWRFALSLLHELFGSNGPTVTFADQFQKRGHLVLETINKRLKGISTSSCGRLFDAVTSLCNIGHQNHYEGQLPCLLQNLAEAATPDESCYQFSIEQEKNCRILNYLPIIHDIINDRRDTAQKAYTFHKTLAEALSNMAEMARDVKNLNTVGLTGGVFQNTLLLRLTKELLEEKGFKTLIHRDVPPNDGGISLGQALLAGSKYLKEI
jgi:hydrogenase maturation protein HypF